MSTNIRSIVPTACDIEAVISYNLGIDKWEVADAVGAKLFGRALRLRVLLWVRRRDGVFFQSEAARGVDYSGVSAVAKELDTLEELGMIRKFGRPARTGRQNYTRTDSSLWQIIDAVEAELPPEMFRADEA